MADNNAIGSHLQNKYSAADIEEFKTLTKKVKDMADSKNVKRLEELRRAQKEFIDGYRSQRLQENSDKLFQDVIDYNRQPSESLKRKIDYFFQPYINKESIDKYMRFNELRNIHENVLEDKFNTETSKQVQSVTPPNEPFDEEGVIKSRAFPITMINTLKMRQQPPSDTLQRVEYLWSDFKDRILKLNETELKSMKRQLLLDSP